MTCPSTVMDLCAHMAGLSERYSGSGREKTRVSSGSIRGSDRVVGAIEEKLGT